MLESRGVFKFKLIADLDSLNITVQSSQLKVACSLVHLLFLILFLPLNDIINKL